MIAIPSTNTTWPSREASAWFTAACLGGFALVVAVLIAMPGRTVTAIYPEDVLLFVDAAYRTAEGQVHHMAYHAPFGVLASWLPFLGLITSGSTGGALPAAVALFIIFLTPPLLYVVTTRLPVIVSILLGVYILLLVGAPLCVGDLPSRITLAMWYNRFCQGLLILQLCLYLSPSARTRWHTVVDGVLAGIVCAVMLYLKITYGLVSLAAIVLWSLCGRTQRASALLALGCVAAVATGLEVAIPGIHVAYAHDVHFAMTASAGLFGGIAAPLKAALNHANEVALGALALGLGFTACAVTTSDALFVAFVLAASLVLFTQNTADRSLPEVVLLPVLVAARLAEGAETKDRRLLTYVIPGLLVVFMAEPFVYRSLALYRHFSYARVAPAPGDTAAALPGFVTLDYGMTLANSLGSERAVVAINEPGLTTQEIFQIARSGFPDHGVSALKAAEYMYTINKGIETLSGIDRGDGTVLTFDFSNPFPFAMNLPSPRNSLLQYHYRRQFSEQAFIPSEVLFSDVSVVMIPTLPSGLTDRNKMISLYEEYLQRNFTISQTTDYWVVWTRQLQVSRETKDEHERRFVGSAPEAGNRNSRL